MPGPALAVVGAAGAETVGDLGAADATKDAVDGATKDATDTAAKPEDIATSGNGSERTKKFASEQALAMVRSSLDKSVDHAWEGLNAQVQASNNSGNPKNPTSEEDNGAFNATMDSAGAKLA